ncbi:hypothetical protein AAVH_06832 [Aphelenchoides avenae]|nr:hypothetical protein AAVH_06832 [Aphelenchus avenae]
MRREQELIKKGTELARLESEKQQLHGILAPKYRELREASNSIRNLKKKASKRDAKVLNEQLDDAHKKGKAASSKYVRFKREGETTKMPEIVRVIKVVVYWVLT